MERRVEQLEAAQAALRELLVSLASRSKQLTPHEAALLDKLRLSAPASKTRPAVDAGVKRRAEDAAPSPAKHAKHAQRASPAPSPSPSPAPAAGAPETPRKRAGLLGRLLGSPAASSPTSKPSSSPAKALSSPAPKASSSTAAAAVAAVRPPAAPTMRGVHTPSRPVVVVGTLEQLQRAQESLFGAPTVPLLKSYSFLPFRVMEAEARAAVLQWAASLWFAPATFLDQLKLTLLPVPVLVPYYYAYLSASVDYEAAAMVPSKTGRMRSLQKLQGKLAPEFRGLRTEALRVAAAASRSPAYGAHSLPLLEAVSNWEIDHAVEILSRAIDNPASQSLRNLRMLQTPQSPFGKRLATVEDESGAPARPADLSRVDVPELMDLPQAWRVLEPRLLASIRSRAVDALNAEHPGIEIRKITLREVVYSKTTMKLFFLPAYFCRYTCDGVEYHGVVNGATGLTHAQRPPYGLGRFLGTGASVVEDLLGTRDLEFPAVVDAERLRKADSSLKYPAKGMYLVWPMSHNYVLGYATGTLTLRNRGKRAVDLYSYNRSTHEAPNDTHVQKFALTSGATETFDYCGMWAVRIDGDPANVEVVDWQTTGGGVHGNQLGMA